jgi:hypothetical protein
VTDEELKAGIIERLKDGSLPTHIDSFPGAPGSVDLGAITMGGQKCCACDGADPHHTYTMPSGKKISFHEKCERIWKEERWRFRSRPN